MTTVLLPPQPLAGPRAVSAGHGPARVALGVAMLASAVLLVVFAVVVVRAVRQAEATHRAQAALLEATWRCNALATRAQREGCRCRLQPASPVIGAACPGPGPRTNW